MHCKGRAVSIRAGKALSLAACWQEIWHVAATISVSWAIAGGMSLLVPESLPAGFINQSRVSPERRTQHRYSACTKSN